MATYNNFMEALDAAKNGEDILFSKLRRYKTPSLLDKLLGRKPQYESDIYITFGIVYARKIMDLDYMDKVYFASKEYMMKFHPDRHVNVNVCMDKEHRLDAAIITNRTDEIRYGKKVIIPSKPCDPRIMFDVNAQRQINIFHAPPGTIFLGTIDDKGNFSSYSFDPFLRNETLGPYAEFLAAPYVRELLLRTFEEKQSDNMVWDRLPMEFAKRNSSTFCTMVDMGF